MFLLLCDVNVSVGSGLLIRQWEAVWRWEVGHSGNHPNGEICSAQPWSGPSTLSPILKALSLRSWVNFAKILIILRNIRVKIMSDGCCNSGREIRLWYYWPGTLPPTTFILLSPLLSPLGAETAHLFWLLQPSSPVLGKVDVPLLLNKCIWDQDMTDLRMYLKLRFSQTCPNRRSS